LEPKWWFVCIGRQNLRTREWQFYNGILQTHPLDYLAAKRRDDETHGGNFTTVLMFWQEIHADPALEDKAGLEDLF
jgi:hypothetical protein